MTFNCKTISNRLPKKVIIVIKRRCLRILREEFNCDMKYVFIFNILTEMNMKKIGIKRRHFGLNQEPKHIDFSNISKASLYSSKRKACYLDQMVTRL